MKKEVAKKLLKLVNVKSNTDLPEFYAKERVQILYRQMEQLASVDEIRQIQGAIREIKRLTTIRDEVIEKAKDKYDCAPISKSKHKTSRLKTSLCG